jgi:hypothetical protein
MRKEYDFSNSMKNPYSRSECKALMKSNVKLKILNKT